MIGASFSHLDPQIVVINQGCQVPGEGFSIISVAEKSRYPLRYDRFHPAYPSGYYRACGGQCFHQTDGRTFVQGTQGNYI